MTTSAGTSSSGGGGGIIVAFAIFVLLFVGGPLLLLAGGGTDGAVDNSALQDMMAQLSKNVGDLELTNHAKVSHAGETFDAPRIQQEIASGRCVPHEYYCPETKIVWCKGLEGLSPGNAIGLVISLTTERIITGFQADENYWRNKGCR